MKRSDWKDPSSEHEEVYHAASRRQAASLSLTAGRLHDLVKACSVEGKKTGRFASQRRGLLSGSGSMSKPSLIKRRSLIGALGDPESRENAQPHVGECPNGDRMTFAFFPFSLIVVQCPRFAPGRLPSKQVEGIAQGFQTGRAAVSFLVVATLVEDGSCASQCLKASSVLIARRIISQFCQQPGSQSFSGSGQALKNRMVLVGQKKGLDVLVIGCNLLSQRQQLPDQNQHQARLGAHSYGISRQLWLVQGLIDFGSNLFGRGMTSLLECLDDLLLRGSLCGPRSGEGLQKEQRRALLQLAEQVQSDGIVGYASGDELIDQAGLQVNEPVLITGECLEFGNLGRVWFQLAQVGQLTASQFRQQVGIDPIGFGSRCASASVDRLGIDWIDRETGFEQSRNEQAAIGLNNTGHLFLEGRSSDAFEQGDQFFQALFRMRYALGGNLTSRFINDDDIMMIIGQSPAPAYHTFQLLSDKIGAILGHPLRSRVLIHRCSKHVPLIIDSLKGATREAHPPTISRTVGVLKAFPWRVRFHALSLRWVLALCREGYGTSLRYKVFYEAG
jgi:hypothetical protein